MGEMELEAVRSEVRRLQDELARLQAAAPIARAVPIGDVLNRRTDLSTFVVHLTRDGIAEDTAAARLRSIIRDRRLRTGTASFGWAVGYNPPDGRGRLGQEQRATQRAI